jgi:hypothetical protein
VEFGEGLTQGLRRCQPQGREDDQPGKERQSLAQRHGGQLNDQYIQQAGIEELTRQFATTGDPDVLPHRSGYHLLVHRLDRTLLEAKIYLPHGRKLAVRENPRGLGVESQAYSSAYSSDVPALMS